MHAPVTVQYRRTIWSEHKVNRGFECGITLKDIVDRFEDKPLEFETHGGVYMARRDGAGGCYVHRKHWHRVKPKAGMMIFVSLVPHGGMLGGGGVGKQIFTIVAAVALLALTAGTVSFLTPFITAGWASVVGGAVAAGGGLLLQTLNKPSVGREAAVTSGPGGAGPTLGTAGIAQNPIVAWAQIPCIKGTFRGSPPVLAKPYVLIDKTDQVAYVIVGYAGQYDVSNILINDTAVEDFATGVIEYEVKEGWMDDTELTLITESVFEENLGTEMSKHRVHADQLTLIEPAAQSYPRPMFMKTANNTDRFRIILNMPAGLGRIDTEGDANINLRIRFRLYTDGVAGAWVNMPELLMEGNVKTAFRQQLWFFWGDAGAETETMSSIVNDALSGTFDPYFSGVYLSTAEWSANSYFGTASANEDVAEHTYITNDGVHFYLSEATFPKGQYEFEIKRSFARNSNGTIPPELGGGAGDAFLAGMFTSTGGTSVVAETISNQRKFLNTIILQSYASFRSQYPIRRKGLALIAVKARNIQIQSISALFRSYVTPGIGQQIIAMNSTDTEELSYTFYDSSLDGGSLHGWGASQASGGPATAVISASGMVYKSNSATDARFFKTISFLANEVDRIILDVETVAVGSGLQGAIFCTVSTGGSMTKTFTFPALGMREVFELDMTTATATGGASGSWAGKTLTAIRFDNENGGAGHFLVRSVRAIRISDGTEQVISSNPAHHFYDIMTGELNARPVPAERVEDLEVWSGHCFTEGLTLNRVIENGSTEDALVNAAGCGDAILRRSDRYGVVVDKDRSEEESGGLVSPHIMISPLVVSVRYLTAARGLIPSFHDASNDYAITEFDSPIFDDGLTISETSLVESTAYEGLTSRFLVQRRALRDLRAGRIRNKVYSFGLEAKVIDFKKGDKIGLAHDILLESWASGRVQSFSTNLGLLVSITMNTEVIDIPANPSSDNLFIVSDVFLLENFFSITSGYSVGAHVELEDGSIVTVPISNVSGKVLTVDGSFGVPSGLVGGSLINVGPTTRESRDVIVTNIQPETGLRAKIDCVDLGAEIYHDLVA